MRETFPPRQRVSMEAVALRFLFLHNWLQANRFYPFSLHGDDAEYAEWILDRLADGGYGSELFDQECRKCTRQVGPVDVKVEFILYLLHGGVGLDQVGSRFLGPDTQQFPALVFIVDFSEQLFDDIFHGDDSRQSAVFVKHHGNLELPLLELEQHVVQFPGFGHIDRWEDEL